jgi:8-oxo-dGTP pyrophosphatase MutT (NUDIX family)
MTRPQFKPHVEIVALYIEEGARILLLHRQENKSQGNKWGIPGGKVSKGESLVQAVLREALEETGYDFSKQQVQFLKTVFIEHNERDHIIYHMFRTKMNFNPADVRINFNEHKGFTWITPQEALKMNLMDDEADCFKLTYGM